MQTIQHAPRRILARFHPIAGDAPGRAFAIGYVGKHNVNSLPGNPRPKRKGQRGVGTKEVRPDQVRKAMVAR